MRWRIRSLRTRILLLALVPMLSLFGLYLYTTSITARDALNLAHTGQIKNVLGLPVGSYVAQVGAERPLAVVFLSDPTAANLTALRMQGARTDRTGAMLRAALTSPGVTSNATPPQKKAIAALLKDVAAVGGLRAQITSQVIGRQTAFGSYNHIVTDADNLFIQEIRGETDAMVVAQGLTFVRIGQSGEMLQQEAALIAGDLAAGSFPPSDRQQFAQLAGARRALYGLSLSNLDPPYRVMYQRDVSPQALATLTGLENAIMSDPRPAGPPPVRPQAWQQTVQAVAGGLSKAGYGAAGIIEQQANSSAHATDLRLFLTGGAGLLAVIISILVAIFLSRGLVRELTALRRSALELANERLPRVVTRLASGQRVELPSAELDIPTTSNEIGQVRDALAKVQRTAVEAAVGQARLRDGISDVFRNLARRSQSLLHRQLTLLDNMERRAADPEQLADLFRIDHLTTRMRRHAESLIILSGQAPARGWRNPVPLVDVLRAAVAEVEDYTRIKVVSTSKAALAGSAVADIIHMIAELAENATVFSPPNTPVVITGDIVGQGFAVEIEDRGLGLSEEKLAHINDRLANPPPFDPSGTDQLGLFVAGQLAKRNGIRVSLRTSPYGGTTAIVLIPHSLVMPEGADAVGLPASPHDLALRPGRHTTREALQAAGNGQEPAGWTAGRTLGARSLAAGPYLPQPPALDTWNVPAAGPRPREGDAVPAADGPEQSGDDTGPIGLPRRIRQASLAPQLRASTPRTTPPAGAGLLAGQGHLGEGFREGPTPDETRATLSAIQQGWQRGRSVFEPSAPAQEPAPPDAGAPEAADGHAGSNGHAENPGEQVTGKPADTMAASGDEVGMAGQPDGPAHESEPGSETGGTRGWS